jgi:hypothetical protein
VGFLLRKNYVLGIISFAVIFIELNHWSLIHYSSRLGLAVASFRKRQVRVMSK